MLFSDWFAQVLFLVHRPLKVAGIVGMAFSSITIVAGFAHRCGRRRPLKVAGFAHWCGRRLSFKVAGIQ